MDKPSSFSNGVAVSSQQSPTRLRPPVLPMGMAPTDLFGAGGLWPPRTNAGAC